MYVYGHAERSLSCLLRTRGRHGESMQGREQMRGEAGSKITIRRSPRRRLIRGRRGIRQHLENTIKVPAGALGLPRPAVFDCRLLLRVIRAELFFSHAVLRKGRHHLVVVGAIAGVRVVLKAAILIVHGGFH